MNQAFLALGGNIGKTREILEKAIELINKDIGRVTNKSSFYETKALVIDKDNNTDTQNYINSVIKIKTELSPLELLTKLKELEINLGRDLDNKTKWDSRIIDIDIIFYDDQILDNNNLIIPHPEMHKRDFVVVPLLEIDPSIIHPKLNQKISELEFEEEFIIEKLN